MDRIACENFDEKNDDIIGDDDDKEDIQRYHLSSVWTPEPN